jgi:AraC family transcriptional regulator, regulatory protein of adaptative response / methylated-DNA-[protein]-cysteine methyltransferase
MDTATETPTRSTPGLSHPRRPLPPEEEMVQAVLARDSSYEGIFVLAVRSTGIFCRPGCPARTPNRGNMVFLPGAREALAHGYRPCLRCRPMAPRGETPEAMKALLAEVDADPGSRLRDRDLRERGLDPVAVRRWFHRHHGMTFHAYQRARRLAVALDHLSRGAPVTHAAFDSGYDSVSGFQDALKTLTGRSPARSRDALVVHLSQVTTPLGPMLLGATQDAVCLLEFTDRRMMETQLKRLESRLDCVFVPGGNDISRGLEEELGRYFEGNLTTFTTPLLTPGTPFQEAVWSGLQDIPYGETRSYGEQARALGSPTAVRAVARANGDNRIAIVIPCHRVVGSDGSLTGYGGGLERKRFLLELERGGAPGTQGELGLEPF